MKSELVNLLILLIPSIFMSYSFSYSFSKIFNIDNSLNIKKIFIILLFSILFCINNCYNLITLKIIVSLILSFIMVQIMFKKNIKDTFAIVIILTILSVILELLLSPLAAIFITNINNLNNNILIKMGYSILNSLLLILLIKNKLLINNINKLRKIINRFTNFYILSMLSICSLNIIMYMFSYNYRNIRMLIVIIVCILIIIVCLNTIINDKNNNKLLKEKNKILKDEHKAYANTIDECRELKHNLKNELYSIKTKLPKEKQNIINSIISKYNNNYEWINILNDIPEGLQGLIYLKINEAKLKKIRINLNIKSSLKTSENDYLDLSTILGILIDNAIEASELAKSKTIVINISENKNIINVQIINRYINNIDINNIGNKNYSTKEYKSGLGLNYITKLNKPNIKVKFYIIEYIFNTILEYKNK